MLGVCGEGGRVGDAIIEFLQLTGGLPKPSLGRTDCKPTSVSYYVGQYLAYWRLVTLNLTLKQEDTWGPSGDALHSR